MYGSEAPPPDDTRDLELVTKLMEAWRTQIPQVHRALMARHRRIWKPRYLGVSALTVKRGTDFEAAWHITGDASPRGVRRLLELCDAGYRILHTCLRQDMQL